MISSLAGLPEALEHTFDKPVGASNDFSLSLSLLRSNFVHPARFLSDFCQHGRAHLTQAKQSHEN
jgi:hypothetical protein